MTKEQEIDDKEQALALNSIQTAQDHLYGIIHRTEHPVDVTDKHKNVWRAYRQYNVTDLESDLLDAFSQLKDALQGRFDGSGGYLCIDVYLPDTDEHYHTAVEYNRIASISTMEFEIEVERPMVEKLAKVVHKHTGRTEFVQVDFLFHRGIAYGA